jgi:predicted DCC family thiol-disulfide oxidoreductase YuxK
MADPAARSGENGPVLIYDGDCGFCATTVAWLRERLRTPVTVVPWQEVADLDEIGLTREDVSAAVWWVDVYGRRWRGAQAVGRLFRLCRMPLPLAGAAMSVPPVSWVAAAVYELIARNRYRLPGATAACAAPQPVAFRAEGDAAARS